jgi:hypothetical protein
MADPIPADRFMDDLARSEETDPAHPITTAQLLDALLGLQAAFRQCNEFAVSPDLSDRERAQFAALSTEAFGVVRAMVGPSMCTFLTILHQPQTPEATRREMREYLSGFLSEEELDGLGEDELCGLLLQRLRAQGFPVDG